MLRRISNKIIHLKQMTVFIVFFIYYDWLTSLNVSTEKIRYISTEHPSVDYYNPKFLAYANLTTNRYGRANPTYYMGLHYESLTLFGNNVTVDFYFYEYLSNQYKRGFIEMHFKLCDFLNKDKFLGAALRQGKFLKPCPYPADDYHFYNITFDVRVIPAEFPFRKGRVIANITSTDANEAMASGYIDMEIKEKNVKRKKEGKSRVSQGGTRKK